MQLTKAGDYGIQGMIHLASIPNGKDAGVAEIAKACNISSSFLAKIFQNLSKAGLVRSQRGAKGGFVLAKDPDEITLLDIIESIEGPIHLNKCLIHDKACEKSDSCNAHKAFKKTQQTLVESFKMFTLKDLVSGNGKFRAD